MKKLIFVLTLGLVLGIAGLAQATLITYIGSSPAGELNMYQIYNALYTPSIPLLSNEELKPLENDTAIGVGLFSQTAGKVYWVARYAGYAHQLSTYDSANHLMGSDPIGTPPGSNWLDTSRSYVYSIPSATASIFGFNVYVPDTGQTWYTQKSLNNPADNGYHFLVLNTPIPGRLLVGVEDMNFNLPLGPWPNTDRDHNDVVFEFDGISPVPEPTSMMLLGMGILGLFGLKRKRA